MMPGSSSTTWKSAVTVDVPDKFPAGLRVLVVDDDPTCLMILEKMLKNCNYQVTICNRAEIALSLLRENTNGYDIVLSDVHMPDMDGFKLLQQIGLEMDLPVIMMSADDSKGVVMKGVTHGACDYLIKPVRMEALRNIWQHVVRKRKHVWKDFDSSLTTATDNDSSDQLQKPREDLDYSSSANEGHNGKNTKKRNNDEEDEVEDPEGSSTSKKPRVVWSIELHQQFVSAVNHLGIEKAVPKKILELMNVPGLTRENVASHLQKYRLYLRRLSESKHFDGPFMGIPDMGSIPGLELQSLAAVGGQSLASLQAALLANSKSPILVDQRNVFNANPGYGELNNSQQRLLHGIPTNIEPMQFAGLHQSRFNNVNGGVMIPNNGHNNMVNTKVPSFDGFNQIDSGFQDINGTFNDHMIKSKNENLLFPQQYNQEDLLTAVFKQPQSRQQGFGQLENEFGYALDDLPV